MIDVSDPSSPVLVATYDTPYQVFRVAADGGTAYLVDFHHGLMLLDVSDPATPRLVGLYDTRGDASGIAVADAVAYISVRTLGLAMVDVSNDCENCAVDLNGDGVVNTQDFVRFLNAWAARDPLADWDGNGEIDTRDFVAYLNAWVAGC
jgi:hypothetical protein